MALFFFPGVGVVDDQVGQGELAGGLGGGDQAVDGLGLPGEGIGGCSTPRGGQRDLAILMRVRAIEHGTPPLRGRVVVADQVWVGVEVHAVVPHRAGGGGDQVRGPITPTPLVLSGRERDRDVVAQQVDHVGLGGTGDRNDGGNVFVRVRDVQWAFVQASAVGVDDGGGGVEDVLRCGLAPRILGLIVAALWCWRKRTRIVVVRARGSTAFRSLSWSCCLATSPLLVGQCARIRRIISCFLRPLFIRVDEPPPLDACPDD